MPLLVLLYRTSAVLYGTVLVQDVLLGTFPRFGRNDNILGCASGAVLLSLRLAVQVRPWICAAHTVNGGLASPGQTHPPRCRGAVASHVSPHPCWQSGGVCGTATRSTAATGTVLVP